MTRQQIQGLAAAAAAVLLLGAALFLPWIHGVSGGIRSEVSLWGLKLIHSGGDSSFLSMGEWSESSSVPDGFSSFVFMARVQVLLILAGILSLLLLAVSTRKKLKIPIHPGNLSLILTLILIAFGVLLLTTHPFKGGVFGTGPGFLVSAGGDIAALIASLLLGRTAPLREDDWFE